MLEFECFLVFHCLCLARQALFLTIELTGSITDHNQSAGNYGAYSKC